MHHPQKIDPRNLDRDSLPTDNKHLARFRSTSIKWEFLKNNRPSLKINIKISSTKNKVNHLIRELEMINITQISGLTIKIRRKRETRERIEEESHQNIPLVIKETENRDLPTKMIKEDEIWKIEEI